MKKIDHSRILITLILIVLTILWIFPIYIVALNSVKTLGEIFSSPLNMPKSIQFQNYIEAWKITGYPGKFLNSLIVTVSSILLITICGSMAGYKLSRSRTRLSKIIFLVFVSCMLIPFHVVMIPLVKIARDVNLVNNLLGLSLIYTGMQSSFAIFLYHGFVKTIPTELDEAAKVDGCSAFGTFWRIIFPLLGNITLTIIILSVLYIWNDFLMPLLLLQNDDVKTLPVTAYSFISRYARDYTRQLPAVVLCAIPVIIFYVFVQKYVTKGIIQGSVKG